MSKKHCNKKRTIARPSSSSSSSFTPTPTPTSNSDVEDVFISPKRAKVYAKSQLHPAPEGFNSNLNNEICQRAYDFLGLNQSNNPTYGCKHCNSKLFE